MPDLSPSGLRPAPHSPRDSPLLLPEMPKVAHFVTKEPNAPLPGRCAACRVRQPVRKTRVDSTAAGLNRELGSLFRQVCPLKGNFAFWVGIRTPYPDYTRQMSKLIRVCFPAWISRYCAGLLRAGRRG